MGSQESRLGVPQNKTDILTDIISWIQLGDCIVLHIGCGKCARLFHRLGLEKEDPETYRTIYIDINNYSLAGDNGDRLSYYILKLGGVLCTDKIMEKRICERTNVPNLYDMKIEF